MTHEPLCEPVFSNLKPQSLLNEHVGVASMNVGETASLTCSPKFYGYGSEGAPTIGRAAVVPAGAPGAESECSHLKLQIELLSALCDA